MDRVIIFDMDGTLFETEKICLPAFYKTFSHLKEKGYYTGEIPTDEQLLNQLGKVADDFWIDLLPEADQKIIEEADEIMFRYEKHYIEQGMGQLYPAVVETLSDLKNEGFNLFIASNGGEEYIDTIINHFKMQDLFVDLYSAGRFGTKSKIDLVRLLKETYNVKSGYMVGDRSSDVEAGRNNHLTVVGCNYGFAERRELADADFIIHNFKEIVTIVK